MGMFKTNLSELNQLNTDFLVYSTLRIDSESLPFWGRSERLVLLQSFEDALQHLLMNQTSLLLPAAHQCL